MSIYYSPMPSAGDPLGLDWFESMLSRDDAGALLVCFRWKNRRRRCSALVVSCGGAGTAADLGDPEAVEPLESTSWKRRVQT